MTSESVTNGIRKERDGAIVSISIDREAHVNALDYAALLSLHKCLTAISDDETVRVVILTSVGSDAFCVGADLEAMATLDANELEAFVASARETVSLIDTLGKPVIGAVKGLARGLGCDLALACHIRIATPTASFVASEFDSGSLPVCGFSTRLSSLIGHSRALELMLSAECLSAARAEQLGVVNRLVEHGSLHDRTMALAREISRSAPLAVKAALEVNERTSTMSMSEAFALEQMRFSECFNTEDMQEGVKAFLEKRPPEFKGK